MHVFSHVSPCHLHCTVMLMLKTLLYKRTFKFTCLERIRQSIRKVRYRASRYLSLFSCNKLMCSCENEARVANYCNYIKIVKKNNIQSRKRVSFWKECRTTITNSIKCVWYWLSTGIQWKLLWYCSPRNCYRRISVLYVFTKGLWVTHIQKLHQFLINSRVYYCCNLL